MKLLFLIIAQFLIISVTSNTIPRPDDCINQKVANLKNKKANLSQRSTSKTINRIYKNAELLCTENFKQENLDFQELAAFNARIIKTAGSMLPELRNCLSHHLLTISATGKLIDTIDKNLLNSYTPSQFCKVFINAQTNKSSSDECLKEIPSANTTVRLLLLGTADYSSDIVADEKKKLAEALKSNFEAENACLIDRENKKM